MTILVVGAGGLLGRAFVAHYRDREIKTAGRRDIVNGRDDVERLVQRSRADLVINCAADTDVEGAERDPETSRKANADLPGLIAEACRGVGARLVHVSSTGCYGTVLDRPYIETDDAVPTTVHHRHKLEGESRVRGSGCTALVLRTGWLFGAAPGQAKNFVWKRLIEARLQPQMESDPFQRGNPTHVTDVAKQAALLVSKDICGTFNCVSAPPVTRLDYVRAIVDASGLTCEVVAKKSPFFRLACVSPNEAGENAALREQGLDLMPSWRIALPHYVTSLMESDAWSAISLDAKVRA